MKFYYYLEKSISASEGILNLNTLYLTTIRQVCWRVDITLRNNTINSFLKVPSK